MEVEEAEERNTELLDLGLGIGDYYVPKGTQKQRKKDTSVPFLQLSVTFGSKEEEGINVKGPSVHQEEEEEEEENGNNKKSDFISIRNKNGNIMSSRKKLRLTKEQSTLLEFSFNQHATLNPVQKHALAAQLNLTPRQVEVWFQNRRARTKLKQTEVDCEILKKCCESLNDENTRLKKELQELKCQKLKKSPLCLHLPICSSCEKKATFQCGYYHKQQ